MRLDSLVRAIEAADPSALRDIALISLDRRGFQPSLTDGPNDGGADFLVRLLPPNSARFAVAISVEKGWQSKLRADALKARKNLKVEALLFISSRVITEPTFRKIADELFAKANIQVQKMDAKDLASQASLGGFTNEILWALGIDTPAPVPHPSQRPDLRQDAAYACAFFGTEAQAFRKTVVENTVLAAVFQGGAMERGRATAAAALSLGLASNQEAQVAAAIDRMLQEGRLLSKNGSLALDPKSQDVWRTARALQEKERATLHEQVDALLAPMVKPEARRKQAVEALVEDLGALWLQMGKETSDALAATEIPATAPDSIRERLRHLEATLDAFGVTTGKRTRLLQDCCKLAAESPFGQALTAGEVFINLVSMKTSHVFRAFGGSKELCAILDTSVAMPLLCSLLHDAAGHDFFVAAKHAYDQLVAHGSSIVLPRDYLEEVASHLLAARDYSDIVDQDPDLRASKNAFVAHYVALREAGSGEFETYADYLASFDAKLAPAKGEWLVERDVLMAKLQGRFKRYQIRSETLVAKESFAKRAQMALAYARRERNDLERPLLLVQHDATTLAWLLEHASDPERAYVICTWDRLHPYVKAHEAADWDVLDPVALGDVLSLASPASEEVRLVSPVFVALSMSTEALQRGAAVWDRLRDLEREKLHDAALLKVAASFKQSWLERATKDQRPRDLQDAWEEWKRTHLPAPGA